MSDKPRSGQRRHPRKPHEPGEPRRGPDAHPRPNVRLVSTYPGSPCARRNACYDCAHRRTIPNDAHTRCGHPDPLSLTIVGEKHGRDKGWFKWPRNFDPVWLRECDGFSPKEATDDE